MRCPSLCRNYWAIGRLEFRIGPQLPLGWPDPPGKKTERISDRQFAALLDRIAANSYKPLG